jgi:cyclic pyranopterin phosphate synthase
MPEELYGEAYKFLKKDEILTFEEIKKLANIFIGLGVNKIRLTGGEPLVRSGVVNLVNSISKLNKDLDLAMTTNGYLLEKYAKDLYSSGLKRLSVSLDTLDPSIFKEMSGKNFDVSKVLDGIKSSVSVGFTEIKINAVLKKGTNHESILDLVDYCRDNNLILRFIEYMDVGTLNSWNKKYVIGTQEVISVISSKYKLTSVDRNYPSEVADRYKFEDGKGEIGFISSVTNPFCTSCSRARISTDGRLVTCLFSESGIDLKTPLRNNESDDFISNLIKSTWKIRDDKYSIDRNLGVKTNKTKIEMFQLGG